MFLSSVQSGVRRPGSGFFALLDQLFPFPASLLFQLIRRFAHPFVFLFRAWKKQAGEQTGREKSTADREGIFVACGAEAILEHAGLAADGATAARGVTTRRVSQIG